MELFSNPTGALRQVSKIVLIATGVFWGLYDVIPMLNQGRGDTLSENLRDWSRRAWVLPWFWGALSAHLFLNTGQPQDYRQRFLIAAGVLAALIVANVVTWYGLRWEAGVGWRTGLFFLGIAAGLLLWSQNQ